MKKLFASAIVVSMSVLLVLPSAVSAQGPAPTPQAMAGEFETVDAHKANLVRVDRSVDFSRYGAVHFDAAVLEPSDPRHVLGPKDEQRVLAQVDASLRKAFRKRAAGEGPVLEVRPVVTDVKRENPLVNAVSFLALQVVVSYGAASVRYELIDAESGRQVGEVESRRKAGPWNIYPWDFFENFAALGHSMVLLRSDSKRLSKDLQKVVKLPARMAGGGSALAE